MRRCTWAVCAVAGLRGGALTVLTGERKFGGGNDLLKKVGPGHVPNQLATMCYVPTLMLKEIRT